MPQVILKSISIDVLKKKAIDSPRLRDPHHVHGLAGQYFFSNNAMAGILVLKAV